MDQYWTLRREAACQLFTPVNGERGAELILDPLYAGEPKFDGERMILNVSPSGVTAINRCNTKSDALTPTIVRDAMRLRDASADYFTLDGEAVGDRFYAFDLLEYDGTDLKPWEFAARDRELAALCKITRLLSIRKVETAYGEAAKIRLLRKLKMKSAEGMMFKRIDSPYRIGRQADQFKCKFWKTASVIVAGKTERRSVNIAVLRDGNLVDVGRLTIPPNRMVPTAGTILEVKYLYAQPTSNCLTQATYRRLRTDITEADCLISQLEYKSLED